MNPPRPPGHPGGVTGLPQAYVPCLWNGTAVVPAGRAEEGTPAFPGPWSCWLGRGEGPSQGGKGLQGLGEHAVELGHAGMRDEPSPVGGETGTPGLEEPSFRWPGMGELREWGARARRRSDFILNAPEAFQGLSAEELPGLICILNKSLSCCCVEKESRSQSGRRPEERAESGPPQGGAAGMGWVRLQPGGLRDLGGGGWRRLQVTELWVGSLLARAQGASVCPGGSQHAGREEKGSEASLGRPPAVQRGSAGSCSDFHTEGALVWQGQGQVQVQALGKQHRC